jgi:hypothetical protein
VTDYPNYVVWFRGRPACPCLAEWYPIHEAELQRRGILQPGQQVKIFQLIGNAPASAGVHSRGGAGDDDQISDEAVWVARQMGADAAWARTTGSFATNKHRHLALRGCPHNGPVAYQIDAVDDDFNGLGYMGRGGPDDGPRPLSGRTWREGIAWANEQGDDMREEDWDRLEKTFAKIVAAEFAKEQKNGRTLRGTVAAIANKLGVKPVED